MRAIVCAVEKQRQESPFYREGNLSTGDLGGEGGVKLEVGLRKQAARQPHNLVGVLKVQVHILHLSCRPKTSQVDFILMILERFI